MNYRISYTNPASRYITVEATTENNPKENLRFQLPSWRPGRYELGNFAKNVRNFRVTGDDGRELKTEKITKDCWVIEKNTSKHIVVAYEYFAGELNAGSTYLDDSQLYINPVNCCGYIDGRIDEPCRLELAVPEKWKIACALKQVSQNAPGKKENPHTLLARNFDHLADSPLIASPTLKHHSFILDGVEFHLWFQGHFTPDWPKLISDFFIFVNEQMVIYKTAPTQEYHFLFQVTNNRIHHGVEHTESTVIAIGPAHKVMNEMYNEFLGVSCHELFHCWNIKAIRPAEMLPYDFTKENYSRLGYVCEGVTTYYGDYLLLRSRIWKPEEYWKTFEERLQKHFHSHARYFLSVADASFDTWLDGYVPGAPHRKTSIYHEGCLLAFVTDIFIRRNTGHKKSLDDVMRRLWNEFALKGKGYSEADYKKLVEEEAGADFSYYWNNYIYKPNSYEAILSDALDVIGCELVFAPSRRPHEHHWGFKVHEPGGATKVSEVYFNSPAEKGGLFVSDEIISVNGVHLKADMAEWLRFFDADKVELVVATADGDVKQLKLEADEKKYYPSPHVHRRHHLKPEQRLAWEKWSGQKG